MSGKTITEKILANHTQTSSPIQAGDIITASIDVAMATDGSGPLTIRFFEEMAGKTSFDPERVLMIADHYVPCPNDKVAGLHSMMERFCAQGYGTMIDIGEGICHQLLPERGYITPGSLIVGGDSHSTSYGALNALGTGVGSSDLAAAIIAGEVWFRVPETICIYLDGQLSQGVTAKDAALWIVGHIGASGATYKAIEFAGEGIANLSISERMTLCNMMVETGAKFAVMPYDNVTESYCHEVLHTTVEYTSIASDLDAVYEQEINLNLATLQPHVAKPHAVDNVVPVDTLIGTPIQMGVLGTCTNGRIDDLRNALHYMGNRSLYKGFQLLIIPASRAIYIQASKEGLLAAFAEKGATILPPGCGPCCGSSAGIPRDTWNVLSTANRNFLGRMGNVRSNIYLASPEMVGLAAITGSIQDPRKI